MIHVHCTCGAHLALLNEQVAMRSKCPKCGARVGEILAKSQSLPPLDAPSVGSTPPSTASGPKPVVPPRPPIQQAKPQTAPTPPMEPSRLRIRKSDEPIKPRPVSLPILEPPTTAAEDPIPTLSPVTEEPASGATSPPPVAHGPPQKARLPVSKGQATDPKGAPSITVPCPQHPGKHATHNCLNCAKPICIECVRQHGYYCSSACQSLVSGRERRTTSAQSRMTDGDVDVGALDEKVGETMATVGKYFKLVGIPVLVIALGVFGFIIYRTFWGPKGQITANMEVSSDMEIFRARVVDAGKPHKIVVQANDELFVGTPADEEKLWSVNLAELEEKTEAAKTASSEESQPSASLRGSGKASVDRDALRFAGVSRGNIIVNSKRQLLNIDAKDGKLKWKTFKPDGEFQSFSTHENGLLCVQQNRSAESRLVNFAMSDGAEKWTMANNYALFTEPITFAGCAVLLTQDGPASPPRLIRKTMTEPRKVIEGDNEHGTLSLGQEPLEEVAVMGGDYNLQFLSLANGAIAGAQPLHLPEGGKLQRAGRFLCLSAGTKLTVYESGAKPIWEQTLSAKADLVAAGGDLVAAKTSQGVIALDAKTGQQRWSYTGLAAETLAAGPDGSVYITVKVPREEAMRGEWANYPRIIITEYAFAMPGEPILTTLALDPKSGKPRWGVKNLGRELLFADEVVYAFDEVGRMQILGGGAGRRMTGAFRVTCFSARDGKQMWFYGKDGGDIYHYELLGGGVFLVGSGVGSMSSAHPTGRYNLQVLECK